MKKQTEEQRLREELDDTGNTKMTGGLSGKQQEAYRKLGKLSVDRLEQRKKEIDERVNS